MKPETGLVVFLGIVALIIVVVNDWWKRRLVQKAEGKGKKARKDLHTNNTQWGVVVAIALAIGAYAFLRTHPDLTSGDFGPLTPLIRWLFSTQR